MLPESRPDLCQPDQFNEACRTLRPLAFSAANRVLRDSAAAEDVVQDVFMQLWRRPQSYDPSRGPIQRYVAMLARSRATDRWRTRSAREAAVERSAEEVRVRGEAAEDAADPVIRRDGSRRMLRALDDVPRDQREAVLLAYGRGLTAHEIARAVDVPLGTAKSRIRLGLQKTRANLAAAA